MNKLLMLGILALVACAGVYLINGSDDTEAATGAYVDGDWTFNVSGNNATIVSNTATGITALNIPSTVSANGNTYNVKVIGIGSVNQIVQNNQLNTGCSLTIPNTVETISKYAFSGCTGFTGPLVIPDSVTSMGESAFSSCSFTSLTLPNTLLYIGPYAFSGCTGFTGPLVIPDSVTSMGDYAFSGCTGFTSLTLSSGLTSINTRAFIGCTGFTGPLVIPDSVTSMGDYAFYRCTGFTSLTLSSGLTSIDTRAFSGCTGFTGPLVIPDSVNLIRGGAFEYCTGFTSLINLANPTFDANSLLMSNVKEVLDLGGAGLTTTSYGLTADEVRTDIEASSYVAPISITETTQKTGAVYEIFGLLPLIMVLGVLMGGVYWFARKYA